MHVGGISILILGTLYCVKFREKHEGAAGFLCKAQKKVSKLGPNGGNIPR